MILLIFLSCQMDVALGRMAAVHKIPYLHVHMAFYTFHRVINQELRRRYPREPLFLITAPEIILITYMYGVLPERLRLRGNLMSVLYALLTYYFCFWGGDFVSIGIRRIARMLSLKNRKEFEGFVLYLCSQYYAGMYGIAEHNKAYNAWETYLFQNVSSV